MTIAIWIGMVLGFTAYIYTFIKMQNHTNIDLITEKVRTRTAVMAAPLCGLNVMTAACIIINRTKWFKNADMAETFIRMLIQAGGILLKTIGIAIILSILYVILIQLITYKINAILKEKQDSKYFKY